MYTLEEYKAAKDSLERIFDAKELIEDKIHQLHFPWRHKDDTGKYFFSNIRDILDDELVKAGKIKKDKKRFKRYSNIKQCFKVVAEAEKVFDFIRRRFANHNNEFYEVYDLICSKVKYLTVEKLKDEYEIK